MRFQRSLISSLLLMLLLGSCSPSGAASSSAPDAPASPLPAPTNRPALPTETSVATPVAALVYPYYLPLVTRLENVSQTIDGVTAQIDWVYVDEGRIAIQYTLSGLDWPDGSMMDAMQQVRLSSSILSDFRLGGFSGASAGSFSPSQQGVITGSSDQALLEGALDAEQYPEIPIEVEIPVEGPTRLGPFRLRFTAPVMNGIRIENIDQTVVANDVAMTLESLMLTPSYAQALLCFEMPSAIDWGLTASQITVGDREFPFSRGGLATSKGDDASSITSAERCNEVGFDITYDSQNVTFVTLTVPKLMASVNEVVSEETVNMANQRLADTGIVFDYENIDHGGNIVILERPDGLSDVEINMRIREALAEQYEGPWEFTVEIPK